MTKPLWTAIILAGQRPGPDKLATHFGEEFKALVRLDGEAMLSKVVRTLRQVPEIGKIVVVSQEPEVLLSAVEAGGGATLSSCAGGISSSINALAGSDTVPWPVFVTTADHPLLTPAMVSEFLDASGESDLCVAMVERANMLRLFPNARRTWLKFSDGHWSGANLFALTGERTRAALTLWAAAEQDRKTAWKLFLHFGPMLFLRAITRTIGLAEALTVAGRRLGLSAKLIPMSDPVAAIDVDKPEDHALAEHILASRT